MTYSGKLIVYLCTTHVCVCVLAAAYPYSYTFRLNHFNESGLTTWNYTSLRLHFVPRSSILLYAQGLAASVYIRLQL